MPAFVEEFDDLLSAVSNLPGRNIILGDFNLHYDLPDKVKSFITILSSLNFHQVVTGPTHIGGHTLDLVIVRDSDIIKSCTADQVHVSDHFVVNCSLNLLKPSTSKTTYSSRKFRDIDHDLFDKDLAEQVDTILDNATCDVNDLVTGYNQACQVVLDKNAPVSTTVRTTRYKPPWFTKTVLDARRARRRCERRWRKSGTAANHQAYLESHRKVADVISEEKKAYYNNKLLNSSTRDMYKTINIMLNKNQCTLPDFTMPSAIANQFSNYFVDKVQNIRNNIDQTAVVDCT